MKKLIILLTIAALVCVTFTAMAAGDGIAFDTSVSAISEGETLQTVLTREGAAAEWCLERRNAPLRVHFFLRSKKRGY